MSITEIISILFSKMTLKTFCAKEKKIPLKTLKHLEKFYKFNQNSGDFVSLSGRVGYPPLEKNFLCKFG